MPYAPQKIEPKEAYYLRFNKDEFFWNVIHAEGHLRNIKTKKAIGAGELNCVVKHLADDEGHANEAISHSSSVEPEATEKWKSLRDATRNVRWRFQGISQPFRDTNEAILAVRKLRHQFESFNPDYDISRCKACRPIDEIMEEAIGQRRKLASEGNRKEKLFNHNPTINNPNETTHVGEKKMARIEWKRVATDTVIGLAGGTVGGLLHFKVTSAYLTGNFGGIKQSFIADIIVGIILVILGINMEDRYATVSMFLYMMAGATMGLGILDQFNLAVSAPVIRARASAARFNTINSPMPQRASYLAAPGVIVNKHGSVPEMAPGTYA